MRSSGYGATNDANSASVYSTTNTTPPTTATWLLRNWFQKTRHGDCGGGAASWVSGVRDGGAGSVIGDARVRDGEQDVGEQIAQHQHGGGDQHRAQHHVLVLGGDRLEGDASEPRPREDDLGDESARKQRADGEPEQRNQWIDGVT